MHGLLSSADIPSEVNPLLRSFEVVLANCVFFTSIGTVFDLFAFEFMLLGARTRGRGWSGIGRGVLGQNINLPLAGE